MRQTELSEKVKKILFKVPKFGCQFRASSVSSVSIHAKLSFLIKDFLNL